MSPSWLRSAAWAPDRPASFRWRSASCKCWRWTSAPTSCRRWLSARNRPAPVLSCAAPARFVPTRSTPRAAPTERFSRAWADRGSSVPCFAFTIVLVLSGWTWGTIPAHHPSSRRFGHRFRDDRRRPNGERFRLPVLFALARSIGLGHQPAPATCGAYRAGLLLRGAVGATHRRVAGPVGPRLWGWVVALASMPVLIAVDALDKHLRARRRLPDAPSTR